MPCLTTLWNGSPEEPWLTNTNLRPSGMAQAMAGLAGAAAAGAQVGQACGAAGAVVGAVAGTHAASNRVATAIRANSLIFIFASLLGWDCRIR